MPGLSDTMFLMMLSIILDFATSTGCCFPRFCFSSLMIASICASVASLPTATMFTSFPAFIALITALSELLLIVANAFSMVLDPYFESKF